MEPTIPSKAELAGERGDNVTFPNEPGRCWLKKEHSDETADSPDLWTHLRDCELPLLARANGEGNGSRETFFISLISLCVCNRVHIHGGQQRRMEPLSRVSLTAVLPSHKTHT